MLKHRIKKSNCFKQQIKNYETYLIYRNTGDKKFIEIEIMIPLRKLKMFKFKNLDDWHMKQLEKASD